ncbi:hypothetical protein ACTXT7_014626, partial [Hymenolepis weldensis]
SPEVYVETIAAVLSKVDNIIEIGFSKDPSFIRAANKACECFVSQNAITSSLGSSRKTAEFLAKYADLLLRNDFTPKIARNIEEGLSRMMKVFRFADDKDIFQKFYGNFLARRLVKNQSVSEESERSMINFLERTCGLTCLRRYNQLLKDLNSARELDGKYHEWLDERFQKNLIPVEVTTEFFRLKPFLWFLLLQFAAQKNSTVIFSKRSFESDDNDEDDILKYDFVSTSVTILNSLIWPIQPRNALRIPLEWSDALSLH